MTKLVAVVLVVLLSAGASHVQAQSAQSLKNTAWKFYVEGLHDSLTFHIGTDTSYSTTSAGEMVVRSTIKLEKDTLKIKDFAGEYNCPDGEGVYRVAIDGDYLSFFMISDPCTTRGDVLNGVKCRKTAAK
jgi:hypothetical protein